MSDNFLGLKDFSQCKELYRFELHFFCFCLSVNLNYYYYIK